MELDFAGIFTASGLALLGQVILLDLTMAGDNVVILGTLAGGLPEKDRRKVILIGVGMALVFLIGFALIATQLLKLTGLMIAGGLLLLWVAYNLWVELRPKPVAVAFDDPDTPETEGPPPTKTFAAALFQVAIAELSMSVDNVLGVAGIAKENPAVLFVGLTFSVMLTAVAAQYIAKLLQRYHWIAWIGLVLVLKVALVDLLWEGWHRDGAALMQMVGWA